MTIPWSKCSERMPPDDETNIIVPSDEGYSVIESYLAYHMENVGTLRWIPYDEATWRELNK